jgi:hypothetical protein
VLHLDEAAEFQRGNDPLNRAEAQRDGGGEILAVEFAAEVENLENELLDCGLGQSGFFERAGLRRTGGSGVYGGYGFQIPRGLDGRGFFDGVVFGGQISLACIRLARVAQIARGSAV